MGWGVVECGGVRRAGAFWRFLLIRIVGNDLIVVEFGVHEGHVFV